ncbi:DUF1398 family protein [Azospirillum sp. HJ39]|uniref:DUF1398 family protein n=1 Tax=Azospirillum sp. HJ39 TaxID=3159496 RepID=UPI0035566D17
MNAQQTSIAQTCLAASHDGTMDFPSIVGTLIAAGFEGYAVDYRRGTGIYYLPDGDSVELPAVAAPGPVAAIFRADAIAAAVREAQAGAPGYSYRGFCETVTAAGCAGYMVSFPGRRVVYYGRTAESHVEHFPQ